MGFAEVTKVADSGGVIIDPAKDATVLARNNAFATLVNAIPLVTGGRIRIETPTVAANGAMYIGRNASRTAATSVATWEVVRILNDASGNAADFQYVSGIKWDDRAVAGNWAT